MDCSVMDHRLFNETKKAGNMATVRSMSRIPQLSKIPVPSTASKIPVKGLKPKKNMSPKITVLSRKPKIQTSILKPVITKRNSIPFKEFNLSKAGTKPIMKRKSIGKVRSQKQYQRPNIPFAGSVKRKESIGASLKKVNPAGKSIIASMQDFKPMVKNEKKTLKEMQEELNAAFEPSEFYKNQILNNKEITMKQLGYITPLKDKRNSRDPAEVALERIQRWSANKKSKASLEKENFCITGSPTMKLRFSGTRVSNSYDSAIRRCTWAPGSSPHRAQPKVDPYEAAMARIKRMSISKAQSPAVQKLKDRQGATIAIRSPTKMTAYDIAMQQLSSLKKTSKVTKLVSEVKKVETKEEADERMEEISHVKSNLEKAFANLSPKNAFKARPGSIYRPLHNLQTLTLTPARPVIQKHRLTDISEHSENESSSTLSRISLGFGRFNHSSISEPSTRDNTPQLTLDGSSFLSFKAPIVTSFADQGNIQSTPCLAHSISKSLITSVTVTTTPSMSKIHMPVPVSAYTSKLVQSPIQFFEQDEVGDIDPESAPIQTPLLLKRMAKISQAEISAEHDNDLGCVKQSLNFMQEDFCITVKDFEPKWEPRYSNYVKHIPMKVKTEEMLADREVELVMSRQSAIYSQCRVTPVNPLAVILSKGDRMHFVPVGKEVSAH